MKHRTFKIIRLLILGFLLGSGSGMAELPESHQLNGYETFYSMEKEPAHKAGKELAVKDHRNGLKRILVYGLRAAPSEYETLLAERYEIYHVPVAGCIVSDGLIAAAEAYNTQMRALLLESYGKDVFQEIEDELLSRAQP